VFDRAALTAAHPTLPLPSYVRVTNLRNDRSVVVRVNDRGPFSRQRLIDVSERTAELLDFKRRGMAPVRVEYVDRAEVDARDAEFLLASYRGPADALAGGSVQVAAAPPRREGISIPGHLPPPPRKSRPKPPPAMAFDTTQAGVTPPISDAVVVLNSPATAEARILMAFETASANP
jgi:rare lipoprotein A